MDTTSIIMGIVLVIIIISPFLIHHMSQKKKEVKFVNELLSLADSENAKISLKEFWRQRYGIGIDELSKRVFYININKKKDERTIIDLSEVDKCRTDVISRNAKNKTGNVTIIERLDLVFTFADRTEKTLQFYNSSEFMTMDNECTLIEKWSTIIKSNLNSIREQLT